MNYKDTTSKDRKNVVMFVVFAIISILSADFAHSGWKCEHALVDISITHQGYSQYRPWLKTDTNQRGGVGVIIAAKKILTTASLVDKANYIEVTKGGRGLPYPARLERMDYIANVAFLTVDDDDFWQGLIAVPFDDTISPKGDFETHAFDDTIYRSDKATILRYLPELPKYGGVRIPLITIDSKSSMLEQGTPVTGKRGLIGIVAENGDNQAKIIPARLIADLLKEWKSEKVVGFGRVGSYYQTMTNPALARYFMLPGKPSGVVITSVSSRSAAFGILKEQDILLSIGGYPIDESGYYFDPLFGSINFGGFINLYPNRGKNIPVTVWREGTKVNLSIPFKPYTPEEELVPYRDEASQPRYAVRGGFVFVELTMDYLRLWDDWWKRAPFPFRHLAKEEPDRDYPDRRIVIIAHVLPDEYTLGYQETRNSVVATINAKKITRLSDLVDAFSKPSGEYQIIELTSPKNKRIVLSAGDYEKNHNRITRHFRIDPSEYLGE